MVKCLVEIKSFDDEITTAVITEDKLKLAGGSVIKMRAGLNCTKILSERIINQKPSQFGLKRRERLNFYCYNCYEETKIKI